MNPLVIAAIAQPALISRGLSNRQASKVQTRNQARLAEQWCAHRDFGMNNSLSTVNRSP